MKTTELRRLVKAVEPDATVSGGYTERHFVVRTPYKLDEVRAALKTAGIEVYASDITGGRFNWIHELFVIEVK